MPDSSSGGASYRAFLVRYLAPHWPKTLLMAVLLLASTGLELLNPQIVRGFVDSALAGAATETLVRAALLYAAVGLFQQAAAVASAYVGRDVGWRATNRLRSDLALHCLRLDLGFHYGRTPGELIERVDGDVARLTGFFATMVVTIGGNALLVAGVLVLLTREDWRFGLGLGAIVLATAGGYYAMRRVPARAWEPERRAFAAFTGFLEERLAGREDLRANGATGYVMSRLSPLLGDLVRTSRRAWTRPGVLQFAFQGYRAAGAALAFGLGAWLLGRGTISLGTVYLVFRYVELAVWPIYHITSQIEDVQRASASVVRIRDLLARRSAIPALPRGIPVPLPAGPLAVELRDVTFAYPASTAGEGTTAALNHSHRRTHSGAYRHTGSTQRSVGRGVVLDGVSFCVAPGRVLGLLGRTGSGKTTISRLLFRFYDPQGGAVLLGGVDVRNAALADVRGRIGIVTQEVQLFHASVRDNLTLFNRTVPDGRILDVLRGLGLRDWYGALPAGLDTPLPGAGLSAGQAQLLAFARAFLREPNLIVLDEATSRLDPATERQVEAATRRLLRGRTGIVIAHRLETVQHVDDILVLENGHVVERGERAALESDPHSRLSLLLRAAGATAQNGTDIDHIVEARL